jgi:hypothetical protein
MADSGHDLARLIEDADAAYRRARILVIDRLAPGEFPDDTQLTICQRQALQGLRRAEQALSDYRDRTYGRFIVLPDQVAQRS